MHRIINFGPDILIEIQVCFQNNLKLYEKTIANYYLLFYDCSSHLH